MLFVFTLLTWAVLPLVKLLPDDVEGDSPQEGLLQARWSLRYLITLMTVVACFIAAVIASPSLTTIAVSTFAIGFAGWTCARCVSSYLAHLAAVGAMFLPYLWCLRSSHSFGNAEAAWLLCGVPGFFPATIVAAVLELNPHDAWTPLLITAIWLTIFTALRRRGIKRAAAFAVLLALLSAYGAMVLHMLFRM